MGVIRVAVLGAAALLAVTVAAARVADQQRIPLAAVVAGATVSQPFGCTALELEPCDPFCASRHVHLGIDLAAPAGTPVHAASGGVVLAGVDPVAGIFVVIMSDGHARILYCHLSRVSVASRVHVSAGDVIGEVGATGLTTGSHLHLQVQVDGRYVDPARWISS